MKLLTKLSLILAFLLSPLTQAADAPLADKPIVAFATSMGNFEVVLDRKKAPLTVANFLQYVKDRHYDGVIFHRVIEYFMVQSGGIDAKLKTKKTREPVPNESLNGLKNQRGTIAMARYNDPDSASSQFYINVEDNDNLDAKGDKPGYTVFGRVILGMNVVDEISRVETENQQRFFNIPVEPVVIHSVRLKK